MKKFKLSQLCFVGCILFVGCDKNASSAKRSGDTVSPKAVQTGIIENRPNPENSAAKGLPDRDSLNKRRRQIATEIATLIGADVDSLDENQWRALRNRYWLPPFDKRVPAQVSGSPLRIKDMFDAVFGKETPVMQLFAGGGANITEPAEQDAITAYHLVAMMIAGNGGASMPGAFADSVDRAEITKGDLILFEIFSDAFTESTNRKILTRQERDSWRQLARSPNDLYRLLALNNYCHVTPVSSEWLDYYRLYLNEKNPEILEKVAALAFMTARPEAAQLLIDMKAQGIVGKNPKLMSKLDESIEFLRTLPKATETGE